MSTDYLIVEESKRKSKLNLLWIGIGSICMFFAGLTSIIFVDNMEFLKPPIWFWYSTIVIVFSSILFMITKEQIQKDKPIMWLLLFIFLLGGIFAYCQFRGWDHLITVNEIYFSGGSKEDSLFYVLTFAHLAHLFAGLIALLVTILKSYYKRYDSTNYLGIELAGTYWHFLTVLWIYLYLFITYL